jgi:hypothetical protein
MEFNVELRTFYSQGDGDRFFKGLNENNALVGFRGVHKKTLIIDVNMRRLSREKLWDLLSLLHRYGLALDSFGVLAERERYGWLRDPRKWWYRRMFKR